MRNSNPSSYFQGGNHQRAARIAREIVKPLSAGDLECVITDNMENSEWERMEAALDPAEYARLNKKIDEIHRRVEKIGSEEAENLCDEYYSTLIDLEWFKQSSWFHLGFQAALRLLGTPPDLHVVKGGAALRKRVAS